MAPDNPDPSKNGNASLPSDYETKDSGILLDLEILYEVI